MSIREKIFDLVMDVCYSVLICLILSLSSDVSNQRELQFPLELQQSTAIFVNEI